MRFSLRRPRISRNEVPYTNNGICLLDGSLGSNSLIVGLDARFYNLAMSNKPTAIQELGRLGVLVRALKYNKRQTRGPAEEIEGSVENEGPGWHRGG
jgi:hypothetical protein